MSDAKPNRGRERQPKALRRTSRRLAMPPADDHDVVQALATLFGGAPPVHREDLKAGDGLPNSGPSRGRGKSHRSLALVEAAHEILEEIQPASIRAVCYRLFTTRMIPSMAKASTSRVSKQITWAREKGLIPWAWIVDETRDAERVSAWADPAAFVETVRRSYRRDRWADQPDWIEVWSEKGTIRGTLAPVLLEYGVTFRVMHGFASSTAVHQIAEETQRTAKRLTVFYVGDWDPSGLHMSALDLPSRLVRYGGVVRLLRLALEEGDLAGLPSFSVETKRADPRFRWFRQHTAPPAGSWTR